MSEVVSLVEKKKAALHKLAPIMCGACKATGLEHAWNAEALLAPVQPTRACPYCKGTGKADYPGQE